MRYHRYFPALLSSQLSGHYSLYYRLTEASFTFYASAEKERKSDSLCTTEDEEAFVRLVNRTKLTLVGSVRLKRLLRKAIAALILSRRWLSIFRELIEARLERSHATMCVLLCSEWKFGSN